MQTKINIFNNIKLWIIEHKIVLFKITKNIFVSFIILILGIIFSKKIYNLTNKFMNSHKIDKTITNFLTITIKYSLIIFTYIITLSNLGVQTASIMTLIGAILLSIGLSLKESISNFTSGILLIILRPIKIGERVIIGNFKGTVENIKIFFTSLCTKDNYLIIIPNNKIISNNIINISRKPNKRIKIIIGVSYNENIDFVKKVLNDVAIKNKDIDHKKGVLIHLHKMSTSSIDFIVYVWTKNSSVRKVYWNLIENFKKQLDYNKINIPFKQIDIHLHKKEKNNDKK